ncbi:hypothetical protein BGZ81_003651, partial [Podila clonocystis]
MTSMKRPLVPGDSMENLAEGEVIMLSDNENSDKDDDTENTSRDRENTPRMNADDEEESHGSIEDPVPSADLQEELDSDHNEASDDDVDEDSSEDKRETGSQSSQDQLPDVVPNAKKARSALADITNTGATTKGKGPKPKRKRAARGKGQENKSQDEHTMERFEMQEEGYFEESMPDMWLSCHDQNATDEYNDAAKEEWRLQDEYDQMLDEEEKRLAFLLDCAEYDEEFEGLDCTEDVGMEDMGEDQDGFALSLFGSDFAEEENAGQIFVDNPWITESDIMASAQVQGYDDIMEEEETLGETGWAEMDEALVQLAPENLGEVGGGRGVEMDVEEEQEVTAVEQPRRLHRKGAGGTRSEVLSNTILERKRRVATEKPQYFCGVCCRILFASQTCPMKLKGSVRAACTVPEHEFDEDTDIPWPCLHYGRIPTRKGGTITCCKSHQNVDEKALRY